MSDSNIWGLWITAPQITSCFKNISEAFGKARYDVLKWKTVSENSYGQIDDLFKEIRLRLGRVRQSDPATAEELKGLVRQLELWVDSLVVDSLKLSNLENLLSSASELAKRLRERLDRGQEAHHDKTVADIASLLGEDIGSTKQPEI